MASQTLLVTTNQSDEPLYTVRAQTDGFLLHGGTLILVKVTLINGAAEISVNNFTGKVFVHATYSIKNDIFQDIFILL